MRFSGIRDKPRVRALRPRAVSPIRLSGSQTAALVGNDIQRRMLALLPFHTSRPCDQGSDASDCELRLQRALRQNRSASILPVRQGCDKGADT